MVAEESTAKTESKRTKLWGSWIVRGFVFTGTFIVLLVVAGLVFQSVASSRDRRDYPPPGQLVDVGGFRLHLYASGETNDGPTVLLLGCGGCTSANWGWVQPGVAEFAPVVSVDRAGLGWSERRPYSGDAADDAEELHTALQNAGIPGPYVLVGHSYGGPVARIYADRYPDDVVGVTLIDPRHPDQSDRFPPEGLSAMSSDRWIVRILGMSARIGLLRLTDFGESQVEGLPEQQRAEFAAHYNTHSYWQTLGDTFATTEETDVATRATGDLGSLPLIVLSADRAWLDADAPADATREAYTEMNVEQAALSSNSRHVVIEGASHTSLVNDREHALQVVEAIRAVVDAARDGTSIGD